jgi:hypothetical protein
VVFQLFISIVYEQTGGTNLEQSNISPVLDTQCSDTLMPVGPAVLDEKRSSVFTAIPSGAA